MVITQELESKERITGIQNYGDISSSKVYPLVDLAKKSIFTRKHPPAYTVLSIIDVKHVPQKIFIVDTTKYIWGTITVLIVWSLKSF